MAATLYRCPRCGYTEALEPGIHKCPRCGTVMTPVTGAVKLEELAKEVPITRLEVVGAGGEVVESTLVADFELWQKFDELRERFPTQVIRIQPVGKRSFWFRWIREGKPVVFRVWTESLEEAAKIARKRVAEKHPEAVGTIELVGVE